MRKAIFLDRDGVINVDKTYVYQAEDFEFTQGAFEALRHFKKLGYLLIVVTNQSGIARGYYREEDFEALTHWMNERLKEEGIVLDAIYHCSHAPEAMCACRKPESGMFEQAIHDFDIDVAHSWMLGDKQSDLEAALGANVTQTIFIANTSNKHAKYCVNLLFDTIKIIRE